MRKTAYVTIKEDGRDKGKKYLLTEMPASQAEKWAYRAFLALANSGAQIPEDIKEAGMVGLATVGFEMLSGLRWHDAEPLLEEMFGCVSFPANINGTDVTRGLVENDVEEVSTRMQLRAEVFTLHTGFSLADVVSRLASASAIKAA